MKDWGTLHSKKQPEPKVIDEYSVWIASDITECDMPGGNTDEDAEPEKGWEYSLVQYDKDEYIKIMDDRNASLEQQLTDTQLALCDVYEMLG